jgi:GT2 family glycosyltransferase
LASRGNVPQSDRPVGGTALTWTGERAAGAFARALRPEPTRDPSSRPAFRARFLQIDGAKQHIRGVHVRDLRRPRTSFSPRRRPGGSSTTATSQSICGGAFLGRHRRPAPSTSWGGLLRFKGVRQKRCPLTAETQRRAAVRSGPRPAVPRCSVVIPVHNKASLTKQCLDSLFETPPRKPFEIVVVDDASSDATREVLAEFRNAVRYVRLSQNSGFATACNAGAEAARSREFILFLNNDTIPCEGWLDTLVEYADRHPEAAVVGGKLLYPDGTIQHAGVAFNLAGDPLHIYVGWPPDHPAVNKSRRFQAVTAACLLVRRPVFESAGGFDSTYLNDLEDVDLCLRLGELGHEIHYCHESALYHLESASRGRTTGPGRSARVYRERWGTKVRHDELDYYMADGLLDVLRIPPDRVTVESTRRRENADVLQVRTRQLLELLRETIRVSAQADGSKHFESGGAVIPGRAELCVNPLRIRRQLENRIHAFRDELVQPLAKADVDENVDVGVALTAAPPEESSPQARYQLVQTDVRATVERCTEAGSKVLVVSKGDDELVRFSERTGWHFPRAADGRYAGYHPTDGHEAVAHLERLRASGARFIVFPRTAWWWLEYYRDFARHLEATYAVKDRTADCLVFDLGTCRPGASPDDWPEPRHHDESVAAEEHKSLGVAGVPVAAPSALAEVVSALLPDDARVAVGTTGSADFPGLHPGRAAALTLRGEAATRAAIEKLSADGVGFLVLPKAAFAWLRNHPSVATYLRDQHRLVTRQGHACEIYELVGVGRPAVGGGDHAA